MRQDFQLHELSIVLLANNHNPTILNPDFLKHSGTIPGDWELEGNPLCTDPIARVAYKNGITIVAELSRVAFSESITVGEEGIRIPDIVTRYIQTLPHVGYRAIGINPKGHVTADSKDEAISFVLALLVNGPWKKFGERPPTASIHYSFTLPTARLNLSVESALWRGDLPVVAFGGNIHRDVPRDPEGPKIEKLKDILKSCQEDLRLFKTIVQQFMAEVQGHAP